MRVRFLICWVILVGLVPASPAQAPRHAQGVDGLALLPPPPPAGSVEARDDLENADRTHRSATPAEIAAGKGETKLTVFHLTAGIIDWFQPGRAPKTEALFRTVELETKRVTDPVKNHWRRARPYQAAPERFRDAIEHDGLRSYSYPSGHATRGTVFAAILGELWPEHREEFCAKGREAGWLRVKGGVHFPSDVYAGRVLGQAIARAMLASPAFQRELAEAKTELAALAPREPVLAH
jgi:acid phosphatase (class A)